MKTVMEILNEVNSKFERCGSTYEINNGWCEEWADSAFSKLQKTANAVEVWATPYFFADTTHSFLRINGKFIDAECLTGVDDHNELPIFKRLIEAGYQRQPVWCEDSNHKNKESTRDISPRLAKEIRSEQIKSGVPSERALKI